MAWEFHVGQRVVCVVDSSPWNELWPMITFPRLGSIYTIREILGDEVEWGFLLEEIVNPIVNRVYHDGERSRGECAFLHTYFRPLDERRLDQFRKHLAPQPRQREIA